MAHAYVQPLHSYMYTRNRVRCSRVNHYIKRVICIGKLRGLAVCARLIGNDITAVTFKLSMLCLVWP